MNPGYFLDEIHAIPLALAGAAILYVVLIAYIRIFGLKSLSKMTGYDFVNTVAIGSLIATTIATGKPSIALGLLSIGALFLVNHLISILRFRNESIRDLVDNKPLLLMYQGTILEQALKRSNVTRDELRAKLREANVLQLSEVRAVVLETTGDVSVLHSTNAIEPDPYLFEDVQIIGETAPDFV